MPGAGHADDAVADSKPGHAAVGAACADPATVVTRDCTDAKAAALAGSGAAAWLACDGACIIRQSGADAEIVDLDGKLRQRLAGARFLPGAGRTDCLTLLPFLAADGGLTLIDPASLDIRESHALAPLYAVDFTTSPDLLETLRLGAQVSCDGKRFFAPSLDGIGFAVLPLGAGAFGDGALEQAQQVVIISARGAYGLGVDSETGTYRLHAFNTGQDIATDAVFEIDMPFFDIDETHLLIRKETATGTEVAILDLADGKQIAQVPYPPEGGLRFRVEAGGLVPVAQGD